MNALLKRVICLMLCCVMVAGYLPVGTFATENGETVTTEATEVITELPQETSEDPSDSEDTPEAPSEGAATDTTLDQTLLKTGVNEPDAQADKTIYVLAGGDFQEAGDHTGSAENVRNILAQISKKYQTMDGMLFVGDYDCETHENDDNGQTAAGITALMGAVQASYSNINDANSILVQGNHDIREARIDATGGHDFDGYSVFVLNEDDYPDGGGTQSGVQALADNLKTWLNNKLGEGYDAPIFITSHLPLAFSPRTNVVGDGKYAKLIFDVLNNAAGEGLNIIFMHGHNHAYGNDNYLGGEAIYLPKGSNINIAELGSTTKWTEETLNFTYMNPGYVGYYNDWNYVTTEGTDKLTMTVFAITGSDVTVERYSANGLYNLKSEGRNGRYVRGSEASAESLGLAKYYTAAVASPQTIALTEAEDYGDIGSWVGITTEATDDVKTANKGWVELIAPVPDTPAVPGTPESTKYVYTLDTDGTVTDKADAAQGYLIVGSGNNNYAMTDSLGRTGVTIADNAITLDAQPDYEWWITSDGKITDGSYYLRFTGSTSWGTPSGSVSVVTNVSQATAWKISHSQNGQYTISYDYSYSSWGSTRTATYYLRYSSNAFNVDSSSNTVRLFSGAEVTTPATEGTPAVPGTNGTYGKIAGNLTYNATAGMTAEQAMALVKGGIDGYYVEAMSTPGSDVAGTKVDDSVLTWEWVDTFNGNTAGDYEVAIKYGDFLLGTAEVVVPATTTYYAAEGNGLYLVDMNTTEANAMAAVKAGVTVYSATDANGSNKAPISDDDVTWNWVDKYNGADSGPYTVEILKDGTSLGTVEVKVDIKYETGIETGWTYIGETEATGGTTTVTYTLDTDGIDYGEEHKYIIVDDNEAIVLNANSSSNGTAHPITISGNTATLNTRDYEYHMIQTSWYDSTQRATERYELITKGDGSQYLYQESNGVRYGTRSSVKFQVNHHGNGIYDIHDEDGTEWYIVYNGGWTVTETTSARVRLYKFTKEETVGGTPGGSIYALIEGPTVYTVSQGASATKALAAVKAGITGYTASDANGTGKTEIADSNLTWKWKNTFNGNSVGSYWVEISYQGKVLGTVEVKVEPGVVNNYPEYPDEGSVKVNKTGTGIDFQSSGIAQVEVSASGVPIKKGADVIVMLDTSSSMTSHTVTGSSKTRAQVLEESLKSMIAQFKTPGADGQLLDIRVAIADFNGFDGYGGSTGTPYDRDENDRMSDNISYPAKGNQAKIYTGDGTLGAGAFIPVEDLAASYTLNYTSGTNYDYAFDAIYQLGTAIKEASTEERDLYVIFMSDGAAMQWNYYHSQGASSLWNNWITGAWTADQLSLDCDTHAYYYDEVDHNGDGMRNEHRMANAVKGDPSEQYEVIRKVNTLGTPTGETNMYMVPGLGAKMFSISFDAQADTNVTEESMDKSIASLASPQTGTTQYYYKVTTAAELDDAFDAIGSEIAYAAYNARFVDQMGDNYNLQMAVSNYSVVDGDSTTNKTLTPKIEILTYDIYTKAEADAVPEGTAGDTVTNAMIGDRKGTYKVLETVTFNADGTEAYSDQINGGKTNILADGTQAGYVKGVIYAKTFLYNTNATGVAIDGVSIPTGTNADGTTSGSTNVLPAETFYWKMGTVQTSELAMRYYVYLTGSMEGTREGGSYPTNEYATLYYDNYLENPCKKDTVSPVMPWKEANVSYAFYLVNEDGQIIVNQTSGQTGSFANKIAVTNPVVFDTVLLNTEEEIDAVEASRVLPDGYTLYDATYSEAGELIQGPVYRVTVNSNATGGWEITSIKNDNTTYVTNYDPENSAAYSYDMSTGDISHDYTHTVVWFAVVWKVQALPDTVVIDYGLPVDISVLTNDMFGEKGKLAGVGAYSDGLNLDGHDTTLASGFGTSYTGTYGSAKADTATGKVRYTPKDMQMNGYDKFAYAVNYTGNENAGYYYDTVTVIPATTIYYEDNFVDLASYTWNNGWQPVAEGAPEYVWSQEGNTVDGTQAEDRPGQYALTDANNIYGYDAVNGSMSTYSMGSAMKAHVDYDNYGKASFTFWGTGFDVISMTSNLTGSIYVDVYQNSELVSGKSYMVDTYYGYTRELYNVTYIYETVNVGTEDKPDYQNQWVLYKGEKAAEAAEEQKAVKPDNPEVGTEVTGVEYIWVVNNSANNSIYQVPVIQVNDLPYGQYTVEISAIYDPLYDNVKDSNETYDFYLDAIRVYDPANDGAADGSEDKTIEDAYEADHEGWPSYFELRDHLINAKTLGNSDTNTKIVGQVFIDGDATVGDAQIADYISYGPNNEVYLDKGQSIAFLLNTESVKDIVDQIHLGIKSADGHAVTYTIKNIASNTNSETGVNAGDTYHEKTATVSTATDMYYDITGYRNDIIVITNSGTSGIISLTNIKATYTENPNGTGLQGQDDSIDEASENGIVEEPASNEVYAYMTPAAATLTLRSLNAPAVQEPEESQPTEPEITEPETTEPETEPSKPDNTQLKHAVEEAKKLKAGDYTKKSYNELKNALKAAERVLQNKNATQLQIDEALEELNEAMDGLEIKAAKPGKPNPMAVIEEIVELLDNLFGKWF